MVVGPGQGPGAAASGRGAGGLGGHEVVFVAHNVPPQANIFSLGALGLAVTIGKDSDRKIDRREIPRLCSC